MKADATVATLEHGAELPFPASVSWGKLMMWLFLCSDAMSFGALIAAYAILRFQAGTTWPEPNHVLGINLTAIMTFILIVSSVTMVKALAGFKAGNTRSGCIYMLWTIVGGLFFLGCQAYEWTHLIKHGAEVGMRAHRHLFDATFFVLTGFHGCHVTGGVIYNTMIFLRGKSGVYGPDRYGEVEIAGLYWHFVDLVWILIFTFVYLI